MLHQVGVSFDLYFQSSFNSLVLVVHVQYVLNTPGPLSFGIIFYVSSQSVECLLLIQRYIELVLYLSTDVKQKRKKEYYSGAVILQIMILNKRESKQERSKGSVFASSGIPYLASHHTGNISF